MGAEEIIAIAAIALIIGGAVFYIIKAKKSGRKCIGCPNGGSCSAKKCKDSCQDGESECCCCNKEK